MLGSHIYLFSDYTYFLYSPSLFLNWLKTYCLLFLPSHICEYTFVGRSVVSYKDGRYQYVAPRFVFERQNLPFKNSAEHASNKLSHHPCRFTLLFPWYYSLIKKNSLNHGKQNIHKLFCYHYIYVKLEFDSKYGMIFTIEIIDNLAFFLSGGDSSQKWYNRLTVIIH